MEHKSFTELISLFDSIISHRFTRNQLDGLNRYVHRESSGGRTQNEFFIDFSDLMLPSPEMDNFYIFSVNPPADKNNPLIGAFNSLGETFPSFRSMCDLFIILIKDDNFYGLAIEFKDSPDTNKISYGLGQAKNGLELLRLIIRMHQVHHNFPNFKFDYFVFSRPPRDLAQQPTDAKSAIPKNELKKVIEIELKDTLSIVNLIERVADW